MYHFFHFTFDAFYLRGPAAGSLVKHGFTCLYLLQVCQSFTLLACFLFTRDHEPKKTVKARRLFLHHTTLPCVTYEQGHFWSFRGCEKHYEKHATLRCDQKRLLGYCSVQNPALSVLIAIHGGQRRM